MGSFFRDSASWIAARDETPDDDTGDGLAERGATPRDLPPRRVLIAEAGIGKTEKVLREIAAGAWADKRVLYLVPSIDLADELAARAREMGIGNAHVIRGRAQIDPENPGQLMCQKAEIATRLATLGYGVTETLCKGKDADGKDVECEFRATCPYFRQLQERRTGSGLLIGAHAYLSIAIEMLNEKRIDLLVIDEAFWQTLVRHLTVPIERFTTIRVPGRNGHHYRPRKGESMASADARWEDDACVFDGILGRTVGAIRDALDAGRPLLVEDFRRHSVTAAEARFAATIEYSRLGKPAIHPGMPLAIQDALTQAATSREAFQFARIWKCLAVELENEREGEPISLRFEIGRTNRKTGGLENVLHCDYTAEARYQGVPVLMIDADGDPAILDRFYPGVQATEIAAEWTGTTVRQVTDRTGSKAAFREHGNRERVRGIALDLADQLAPEIERARRRARLAGRDATLDPRPLVVCQKQVEDAWREEGHRLDYDGGPSVPDAPFRVAHFGNVRGKDDWKGTTAAIIVGRNEPSAPELERLTRAVFYKSGVPVPEIQPDEKGRIVLPKRAVTMTAKDGSKATVQVSYHPDPRADRILRQIREAEIAQAIARVRPVHRTAENPCVVLILTNVPGRVQPDTFATWSQIVPDRFRLMEMRGFVPDLAPDCAAAFPDLFDSDDAVRQAASRRKAAAKCDASYSEGFYKGCHTFEGSVRVEYRREGNRRGRHGTVAARPGDTPETVAQRVREALPDAFAIVVLGPLPDPHEAAQAALDAAIELDAYIEETEAAGGVIWWRIPAVTVSRPAAWNAARPSSRPIGPPDPSDRLRH